MKTEEEAPDGDNEAVVMVSMPRDLVEHWAAWPGPGGTPGSRTSAACRHALEIAGRPCDVPVGFHDDGERKMCNMAFGHNGDHRHFGDLGAMASIVFGYDDGGECGAPSGYHDDGDPMLCTRSYGHLGAHTHYEDFSWAPGGLAPASDWGKGARTGADAVLSVVGDAMSVRVGDWVQLALSDDTAYLVKAIEDGAALLGGAGWYDLNDVYVTRGPNGAAADASGGDR